MKFIILIMIGALVGVGAGQSYEFPTMFTSIVNGWVADVLTNFRVANSTGYMYTDYTIQAQRIDEVWNELSIQETGLVGFGTLHDTHLFLGATGLLWYRNATGMQCYSTPSALIPQSWPSSTYSGTGTFAGQPVNVFRVVAGPLEMDLMVTQTADPVPVAFNVVLSSSDAQLKSFVTFSQFEAKSFSDSDRQLLFTPPAECPS